MEANVTKANKFNKPIFCEATVLNILRLDPI